MNQISANTELHWQQARSLLAAGNPRESVPFLEKAAAALHPAACFHLGCLHLFRLIEPADKEHGVTLIKQAAESGHGGALYQLAMLELSKPDMEPDWQTADEYLWQSAKTRYPVALRTLALVWSRTRDSALLALGTLCLEHAALAGDLASLGLLMERLRNGIGCVQNPLRANAINSLLMQTDLPVTPPLTPAHPHFAQAVHLPELPELPKPELAKSVWSPEFKIISESPWIVMADAVLNQEECRLICYLGGSHVKASMAADPDGRIIKGPVRSSYDMDFDAMQEDLVMLLVQRRMARMVGATPAFSENLQLLRYQNGQEYRPHRDYLPPSMITPLEKGGPGQRNSTVIVYLNDVKSGGETEFIELDRKIAPKMGRVLAFRNLHADGSPDSRTLHAGLPVVAGTKWIATMWIRQGVYRK